MIVLTKTDVADADMQELATLEVRELVEGSFLSGAPIVPVSAKTNDGLDRLRATLLELARQVRERSADGPPRLPIDRVFTIRGFGTVVTGTLLSGSLVEDQELTILPAQRRVKVRGVQVHGRREPQAGAGRRVAVNLGGVDVAEVTRGDTLTSAGALVPSRRVDIALDLLPDARPLRHGARVRFHHGSSELLGRVALAAPRSAGGSISEVPAGGSAVARLRLEKEAVLTRGDRFIIRAYSPPITIGGGRVIDPHPARTAIRTPEGTARLRSLDGDVSSAVRTFVHERGPGGLPVAALSSRAGIAGSAVDTVKRDLEGDGAIVEVEDLLVERAVIDDLSRKVVSELQAHHRAQPLSEGIPREELRERLFGRAAPAVFAHVLQMLGTSGKIAGRDRLALHGHQVCLSPEETRVQDRLVQGFRKAGLAPPDVAAAAAEVGASKDVVDRIVGLLLRQRVLMKVDTLLFHADALESLKTDVRGLKAAGSQAKVDVASFKEKYGITRKFAIPLLEFLDRERVTRRVGEGRIVL